MQTMKIMTLCRNKKINTTRKHWYAFLYAVSLPSDPQTHKNHQKEHFMLHIKQNLNDELMLKTIIASFNAV